MRVLKAVLLARGGADMTGIVLMRIIVLAEPTSIVILPRLEQNSPGVIGFGVVIARVDDLEFLFYLSCAVGW